MSDDNRLPPHNLEAENGVLGSILIDNQAFYEVADIITPEDFYSGFNGQVFRAMIGLNNNNRSVDFITLREVLEARGVTHPRSVVTVLIDLINCVPTSIHAEDYAAVVKANSVRRKLIHAGSAIASAAYDTEKSIDSVVDIADATMMEVTTQSTKRSVVTLRDGLSQFYDVIEARKSDPGGIVGLPTGFAELDKIKGGLKRSEFIVLAGRPGMGKSSLERQIALHAAKGGKSVLRFNLEMSVEQSMLRLVAAEIGVELGRLESAELSEQEWGRYYEAVGRLSDLPIWIDHTPAQTVSGLRSKCRRVWAQHGLDLITVDYLQLLGGERNSSNRVNQIGEISRGLKRLALELEVPVLALAQLNRSVEQRADKRPLLSDLRESGDIENDADCVMFIYRDDYYNPDDTARPNIAEIGIRKNRQGKTGDIDLFWSGKLTKFSNLQRNEISL